MTAPTTSAAFYDYFNAADEIFDSIAAGMSQDEPGGGTMTDQYHMTLADLDTAFVSRARAAATRFDLPWPPYLPAAEEYALAHRTELDS